MKTNVPLKTWTLYIMERVGGRGGVEFHVSEIPRFRYAWIDIAVVPQFLNGTDVMCRLQFAAVRPL